MFEETDIKNFYYPLVVQVFLIFCVWIYLYVTRVGALRRQRVSAQALADSVRHDQILKDVMNPSDNFENQFEMPVLFFVLIFALIASGQTDVLNLFALWAFVFFRTIHSIIHCTTNRIMHRFTAYAISSVVLWAVWARFGVRLFVS